MLLEVKDLTVYYGEAVRAIEDVSLTVREGEIVALIGPNGAGKSTTLKAICGLVEVAHGSILFEGQTIKGFPPYKLVRLGISLVPEYRRLFSSMTVLENLQMGAYLNNGKQQFREALETVFQLFPILYERQNQRAGTLSGGEQQMLAIGRALMLKPRLLMLDEPSLGLSPNYVDIIFDKLQEINSNGVSMLIVEQNARIALEYADRGYVFGMGRVILEDSAESLLQNSQIQKVFLGGA
jgi:branched-chain amino acid transport system ATP-binding protein